MKYLTTCLIALSTSIAVTQPHPTFTTFEGELFDIPIKHTESGYGPHVDDYKSYGRFTLEEINIPNTEVTPELDPKTIIPILPRKTRFATIMHSTMNISVDACYEFSLNSDDGSILWIDDQVVVDNDGGHEMQLKIDSFAFSPGTYKVKLWYFQGFPNKFGCELNAKIVGKRKKCPHSFRAEPMVSRKIDFNSSVFFDVGSYALKQAAKEELEQLAVTINDQQPQKIIITGHTDNVGSVETNLLLSENRAETIAAALKALVGSSDILFSSVGKGEAVPISDNQTEEGKQKNRRVEMVLQWKR